MEECPSIFMVFAVCERLTVNCHGSLHIKTSLRKFVEKAT